MKRSTIMALFWLAPAVLWGADPVPPTGQPSAATNPFFAMNTGARGGPEVVAPLLKELGYDGLGGGLAGAAAMADELQERGLKLFNVYVTLNFDSAAPGLTPQLQQLVDDLAGHDAALWIAIIKVTRDGTPVARAAAEGDAVALAKLAEIADYAGPRGVRVALYPHAGFWVERTADAVRLANQLNRPDVGATFNLCHFLKVEGDVDPAPVLKAALPRLFFVTINGADGGDTRNLTWKQLIQTLDRGSYDVAALLKKLRDLGYQGPIGLQAYGIGGDQRDNLTRSMAAWKRISAD